MFSVLFSSQKAGSGPCPPWRLCVTLSQSLSSGLGELIMLIISSLRMANAVQELSINIAFNQMQLWMLCFSLYRSSPSLFQHPLGGKHAVAPRNVAPIGSRWMLMGVGEYKHVGLVDLVWEEEQGKVNSIPTAW